MSVKWRGAAIVAEIEARTKKAIDDTLEEAAEIAVRDKWWQARRGEEGLVSQVITEDARPDGHTISGKFGSTRRQGFYGLFLERDQPWLRPAADEAFPHLKDRLREGE